MLKRRFWDFVKRIAIATEMIDDDSDLLPQVDLRRIQGEYVAAIESFKKQRDQWRKMYLDEWPKHLRAQEMLESRLRLGRQVRTALGHTVQIDAAPVGVSYAYEAAFSCAGVASAGDRCAEILLRGTSDQRGLKTTNDALFALIEEIEAERNGWISWHQTQRELHAANQSALDSELANEAMRCSAALAKWNATAETKLTQVEVTNLAAAELRKKPTRKWSTRVP